VKVSIVMTYYRRIRELKNTLSSFRETKHNDFEVIVVDDGTWDGEHDSRPIIEEFKDIDIKLIRVDPDDKWWPNPSIPFNIGFNKASGEKIILQNAECFHNGDIISHTANNLKENKYFTYGCYSLTRHVTDLLIGGTEEIKQKIKNLDGLPDAIFQGGMPGTLGWYNHSIHRPEHFHFCAAISTKDLNDLGGGFDERYAHGLCWDDNEFKTRIKKKGMEQVFVDNPFVFHQFHYNYSSNQDLNWAKRPLILTDNKNVYHSTTDKETDTKVNIGDKRREVYFKNEEWLEDMKKYYSKFPKTGYES
jgi:glycosyltransferase involved in cell wall biosynthesis